MQLRDKEIELDLHRSKMKSCCFTSSTTPSPLFASSPFSIENLRMMASSSERRRLSTPALSPDDKHDKINSK